MLIIDYLTIVASLIILLISLIAPLFSPFFRCLKLKKINNNSTIENGSKKEVTIIFTPYKETELVKKNLEKFLLQNYPNFKVIVVIPKEDKDTELLLKKFDSNSRLYTTFIPATSKYLSRKKLAITLGIKAAKTDWIVICDIACAPITNNWLSTLMKHTNNDVNLIGNYNIYAEETPDYWKFEHLYTTCYTVREIEKGIPYRWNSETLAFKKDDFLKKDGFKGNLKFISGELDFIVNKYAEKDKMDINISDDATLIESMPTLKKWEGKNIAYQENRKHLRRSKRHRFYFIIDQLVLYVSYLLPIVAITIGILTKNWIITVVSIVSIIITSVLRINIAKKAIQKLQLYNFPTWKIIPYELKNIWIKLLYKVKYWKADKYDFISHKL